MEKNNQTGFKVFIGILLVIIFIMTLRQSWALRTAGYRASFLASFVSLFDSSIFPPIDGVTNQNLIPNPPVDGVVTTYETTALTKLAEGLFSSNPLYLYRGSRYNLRVTMGDGVRPAVLKNYYVNLVRDGVVYRLDSRVDFAITSGSFTTRVLTMGNHSDGVLDVSAGEYDGYVNMVWDTGTQTIKFKVTVLPAPIVAQQVSAPVVVPQVLPTPVYTPPVYVPPILPISPLFAIEQLAVRDAYGIVQGNVYNYQNQLYGYARMYTSGNGIVYSLVLTSRSNSFYQYQLSSGISDGSGTREISYPLPSMSSLPTGIYELTLVAAPRLASGTAGNFETRRETINLINNSNPVSVVIPPPVTPPTVDSGVVFYGNANLNIQNFITNRQCTQGGDAVNYSVFALTADTATLDQAPTSGCLAVGDEVLLISLQGVVAHIGNVGAYELLRVKSISGSTVTFTTNKKRIYGDNGGDSNLGTSAANHHVMLQRVPNYSSATVNSGATLTANAFDGIKGGVLAFRVNGALAVNGKISMDSRGYLGGFASGVQGMGRAGAGSTIPHCANYSMNYYGSGTGSNDTGGGAHHCYGSGAGGGNASVGANGFGGAMGGSATFSASDKLILGGGGGAAAGAPGGPGGGVIYILATSLNAYSGSITANGGAAPGPCGVGTYTYGGGGGAGGSIYIVSANVNAGSALKADGGAGLSCIYSGGAGGAGRADIGPVAVF